MGRHSVPDDTTGDATNDAVSLEGAAGSDGSPDAGTRHGSTHADLQMLRENPGLRARCIAGAVVPFILYTVVLVVIGRADIYLVWVWIPIVAAGILVGSFLDLGYRSARAASGRD